MHDTIEQRGLVLIGCGKMGSAMLAGWLDGGLPPASVWVQDPNPSDWLRGIKGLNLNTPLPAAPALVLVAVKPHMMGDTLPALAAMGNGPTVFVSVAAGVPIARYESLLGADTPIIRAMPNTPAAVGRGVTALIGNAHAGGAAMDMADTLLQAVGLTVRLESEEQMDAVTAVSGSGPAYVFHMIESLAAAGEQAGLTPDLAMTLAKATVAGAGALAEQANDTPTTLRENVTSPNGVTQAALVPLMDQDAGLPALMRATVAAAVKRSRELGE